jgi:hypothetical protein
MSASWGSVGQDLVKDHENPTSQLANIAPNHASVESLAADRVSLAANLPDKLIDTFVGTCDLVFASASLLDSVSDPLGLSWVYNAALLMPFEPRLLLNLGVRSK